MRGHNDVHKAFYNPQRFIAVRFYRFYPYDDANEKVLAAILNSTYVALFKEIYGSTKLGLGALDTTMADMMRLPIPFPEDDKYLKAMRKAFDKLCRRKINDMTAERARSDRRELDDIIFDLLGLSSSEKEQVYDAVIDLVSRRLEKAKSV